MPDAVFKYGKDPKSQQVAGYHPSITSEPCRGQSCLPGSLAPSTPRTVLGSPGLEGVPSPDLSVVRRYFVCEFLACTLSTVQECLAETQWFSLSTKAWQRGHRCITGSGHHAVSHALSQAATPLSISHVLNGGVHGSFLPGLVRELTVFTVTRHCDSAL